MPQTNVARSYKPQTYYHVYNHAVAELKTLFSHSDAAHFIKLFQRYLAVQPTPNGNGQYFTNYHKRVKLLSYCVMPNHYHLLLYQEDNEAIQEFMQCLATAFAVYFNKKNERRGAVFESSYKASEIDSDEYLQHIIKYIHQNPLDLGVPVDRFKFSSFENIVLPTKSNDWLDYKTTLGLFDNDTAEFVKYVKRKL